MFDNYENTTFIESLSMSTSVKHILVLCNDYRHAETLRDEYIKALTGIERSMSLPNRSVIIDTSVGRSYRFISEKSAAERDALGFNPDVTRILDARF